MIRTSYVSKYGGMGALRELLLHVDDLRSSPKFETVKLINVIFEQRVQVQWWHAILELEDA